VRACLAFVVIGVLAARGALAHAQSKRYPPPPVDPDHDPSSTLWENAADPARAPYCDELAVARRHVEEHTSDGALAAVADLDRAVALVPDAPNGYAARGGVDLDLARWRACADDLQAAVDRTMHPAMCAPIDRDTWTAIRRQLALCQARAGRLADAEAGFTRLAADDPANAELHMRLGETRIAMGKLEDAITALQDAIRQTEPAQQGFMHWLLALAYDRARRPSEAETELRLASGADLAFNSIAYPAMPLISAGDTEYLLGLAYLASSKAERLEAALVYFRRYGVLAPNSPWKKRADEHLQDIAHRALPERLERTRGNASVDLAAALPAVQKAMPALRACVAKLPNVVMSIQLTRVGPRTPDTARDHPHVWGPPPAVTITTQLVLDNAARDELDAANRCLEPLANAIALPPVKERDTWYQLRFPVVSAL
jgi:tetratricopeptide (TPR) repeat protein